MLKVLVACEESQRVCIAFRKRGFEAYSCDILPCSGGHPEWHIQGDVINILNQNWDLIIAHPPCTYLCLSGQKHCNIEKYGEKAIERIKKRDEAVEFFMKFVNADCEHIAIENPVGVISRYYKKATQYIRPCEFGHGTGKRTGLWLKNLPKLKPTKIVPIEYHTSGTGRQWDKWFWDSSTISDPVERSKFRSKTFQGIADAMAEQWGDYLCQNQNKT